jgi:hypothetical protein
MGVGLQISCYNKYLDAASRFPIQLGTNGRFRELVFVEGRGLVAGAENAVLEVPANGAG